MAEDRQAWRQMRSNKSARRNFDTRNERIRQGTDLGWRVEEQVASASASASASHRLEARCRADPSRWNGTVEEPGQGQGQVQGQGQGQWQGPFTDRPKKRQKDARQVVVEAAAAAAASAAGRKEEKRGYYFRLIMMAHQEQRRERERLGIKPLTRLTTREWIKRAKQDPGMWSGNGVAQKCLSTRKSPHKEAETARKDGPNPSEEKFLPFHLIFARLPVRQLFQLRCVCKLWKSMLSAEALALLPDTTNTEHEEYWFVMSRPPPYDQRLWSFRAFSSLDGAFFGFPLPTFSPGKLSTLLGGMHCSLLPRLERRFKVGSHCPRLASAGGLMCAFVHKPDALDDYHVIVFNCLTGSVKVLPPLLNTPYLSTLPESEAVGCNMYMSIDDEDPSRYYIMVTQLDILVKVSYKCYFEIFDSRKGCWKVGHAMALATADSKVSHGDFFYLAEQWRPSATMLAYRAADDLWSKVSVPPIMLDEVAGCPPVFLKYKGRLRQCLALSSGSAWLGFVVWELQFISSEAATWVEVARTPHHIWKGLSYGWEFNFMAEGSLFCMAFGGDQGHESHFQPPLVYDMAQSSWYFLPGSIDFGCISVYRPRRSLHVAHLEGEE